MNKVLSLAVAAALAWAASAQAAVTYSTVDLNPAGAPGSHGFAANGNLQAGDSVLSGSDMTVAALWNLTAESFISLHPAAVANDAQARSYINDMNATRQVGYVTSGFNYGSSNNHAYAWAGTAASAVDLHPAGYTSSQAMATSGNQTVGQARGAATYGQYHATLWTGNSNTIIDLNPTTQVTASLTTPAQSSSALAVANGVQVGAATVYLYNTFSNPQPHAYVWSGTAASGVDINPGGFTQSTAYATTGTAHAGQGLTETGPTHALYWSGSSAGSAVDFNPVGFYSSEIHGMTARIQVGFGLDVATQQTHALVWFGSAASAVDLNDFLPAGYYSSQAYGVTPEGYIIGTAVSDTHTDAFLWVPGNMVPEPASLALMVLGGSILLRRRRR